MNKIIQAINNLPNDDKSILSIIEYIDKKQLVELPELKPINFETSSYLFTGSALMDFPNGYVFESIVYEDNNEIHVENVKAKLEFASIHPKHNLNYLPEGTYGICQFDFLSGMPKALEHLNLYKSNYKLSERWSIIYFTSASIANRIKENYDNLLN